MLQILIPIDGSDNSLRAVNYLITRAPHYKEAVQLHLVNVQHPFPSTLHGVHEQLQQYHHDEGIKALSAARQLLDNAGIHYTYHISVGDPAETIALYIQQEQIDEIIMGTRGMGSIANLLLGSVATKLLHRVQVPVLLVK